MSKKFIAVTIIVLVVALIGGIWWYTSQSAQVEEPADDAIAVNSEAPQDAPEIQKDDSQAQDSTPEADTDEEGSVNDEELPIDEEETETAGATEEETEQMPENDGNASEDIPEEDTQDNEQQQASNQQQQQGQSGGQQSGGQQSGGQMTVDEVLKKLQDAGHNVGYGNTYGQDAAEDIGDAQINW